MLRLKKKTKNYLKKLNLGRIDCAIILGSGLGGFETKLKKVKKYSYKEIPGFPISNVKGHEGNLYVGFLKNKKVLVFSGRKHLYEGEKISKSVYSVLVSHHLKVKNIIITNAAGGISFPEGEIVCIKDHINLMGTNPLIGRNNSNLGERFPDMSSIYNHKKISQVFPKIKKGVYVGMLGPSYETPSEIKMLKKIGGDLAGMSTVFESIVANWLGMNVYGFSLVTNAAAGISQNQLDHKEVTEIGKKRSEDFKKMMTKLIKKI